MKPTVGRIVHYYDLHDGPFPAIITAVWSEHVVSLAVFTENGILFCKETNDAPEDVLPRWSWPPIEKEETP